VTRAATHGALELGSSGEPEEPIVPSPGRELLVALPPGGEVDVPWVDAGEVDALWEEALVV
jgi:hypothetical protein